MPTRSYYLRQAELLRSMAAVTADPGQRQHQLRRAKEYMDLAMSFPDDEKVSPVRSAVTEAQQPTGQQQQQIQRKKARAKIKSNTLRPEPSILDQAYCVWAAPPAAVRRCVGRTSSAVSQDQIVRSHPTTASFNHRQFPLIMVRSNSLIMSALSIVRSLPGLLLQQWRERLRTGGSYIGTGVVGAVPWNARFARMQPPKTSPQTHTTAKPSAVRHAVSSISSAQFMSPPL